MAEERETLRQRLLESAAQQGLELGGTPPRDPAELLAFLHAAAQGEPLPEGIAELAAALVAALTKA